MSDSFADSLRLFCEKLRAKVESGNEVAIITHFDADGIVAGSIVSVCAVVYGSWKFAVFLTKIQKAVEQLFPNGGESLFDKVREMNVAPQTTNQEMAQLRKEFNNHVSKYYQDVRSCPSRVSGELRS
jgi:hypothetical protein